MMLFVLISTIARGISRVPLMLLPPRPDVRYVVVWQCADEAPEPQALGLRTDVTLVRQEGKGLSRSRNCAIHTALGHLPDMLTDAVFLIADDDEAFLPDAFQQITDAFASHKKLDAALFRLRSSADGEYFKQYPQRPTPYPQRPRTYYPCSWEIAVRSRVCLAGIRFDERFGLGSDQLCAGEEDIFLTDIVGRGFKVMILPHDIATTNPVTTGTRVLDAKVLRSKGAVYAYQMPLWRAHLRCVREAASLAVHNHVSPLPILRQLWQGVNYIRTWKA